MSSASDPIDRKLPPSRVRLVLLRELMQEVDNEDELRTWIFDRVAREEWDVYWGVEWPLCAFFDRRDEVSSSLRARPDTDPDMWRPRPEVKFVRLATTDAQKFKIHDAVNVVSFLDGLFVPEDVAANTGQLEAINFSGKVRVSEPSRPAPEVPIDGGYHPEQDVVRIWIQELYVDERLRVEVREHFEDCPSQEITPFMLECGLKPGWRSKDNGQATTTRISAMAGPVDELPSHEGKEADDDDPYRLRGRCDGVYMLYRTAERCAVNPDFIRASKAKNEKEAAAKAKERKKIALEMFNQLLKEMAKASDEGNQLQRKLQSLFGATRLDYALYLMDPHFKHNRGRDRSDWCDWPSTKGKDFLAAPDSLRKPFVTDMLRLIIAGAEQWLDFNTKPPAETKQEALQRWLEDHGLTGVSELTTAFAVIAWNGNGIPTPPKFAAQSTSRD